MTELCGHPTEGGDGPPCKNEATEGDSVDCVITDPPYGMAFQEGSNTESHETGDRILDPFMGSGTTAVAAIQNDRDYIGFELDADNYRDVIERRIGEAKRQRDAGVNADAD